jgi:hypothetical protein
VCVLCVPPFPSSCFLHVRPTVQEQVNDAQTRCNKALEDKTKLSTYTNKAYAKMQQDHRAEAAKMKAKIAGLEETFQREVSELKVLWN